MFAKKAKISQKMCKFRELMVFADFFSRNFAYFLIFFVKLIFAKKFGKYRRKFSHFFAKVLFQWKSYSLLCILLSYEMCKFREKIYANISEEIYEKKTGWEIINYDIIKLKMLSTQSRELSTFFAQLIAAATTLVYCSNSERLTSLTGKLAQKAS